MTSENEQSNENDQKSNQQKDVADILLHDSIKEQMQGLITMLQDFYDSKIAPPTATELDALEYIPLFCINGALIASLLGVTYEEYLMAVDYMIKALDLEEKHDSK